MCYESCKLPASNDFYYHNYSVHLYRKPLQYVFCYHTHNAPMYHKPQHYVNHLQMSHEHHKYDKIVWKVLAVVWVLVILMLK